MRYNKKILKYFHGKKKFIGKFNDDKNVGIGEVGALACGDILKLFIKVEDNKIIDVKVMVFGCLSAFASSTYLAEMLIGKDIYSAFKIRNSDISDALGLPPIKIHCSVLAQKVKKI